MTMLSTGQNGTEREVLIYKNAMQFNLQRGPAQRGKIRRGKMLLAHYMKLFSDGDGRGEEYNRQQNPDSSSGDAY